MPLGDKLSLVGQDRYLTFSSWVALSNIKYGMGDNNHKPEGSPLWISPTFGGTLGKGFSGRHLDAFFSFGGMLCPVRENSRFFSTLVTFEAIQSTFSFFFHMIIGKLPRIGSLNLRVSRFHNGRDRWWCSKADMVGQPRRPRGMSLPDVERGGQAQ